MRFLENSGVRLAVAGWQREAWAGVFYPKDMPPEWRLTYFNTQFNGVYLSRSFWLDTGEEVWRQWGDDCHEDFLFLLEAAPDDRAPESLTGKCRLVTWRDSDLVWFDRGTDLQKLTITIRAAAHGRVTWLISSDGDLGQIERVRTLLELLGLVVW